ncbi:hypothetical protein BDZ94DRAFT_1313118 [Collybia nuda]|uniref:Uncharacterized protein n=1 Tax=Collybia nuda TaxID=64659 RepID=A0A9P5XZM7_9AGAR|nr:hypothetical protein BDZ94DRAFT_1313118 [Collybia nuda]
MGTLPPPTGTFLSDSNPSSSITAQPTPAAQGKGVLVGEVIAVGAALTLIIVIITIITRRIRRVKVEAKMAAAAKIAEAYTLVDLERNNKDREEMIAPDTKQYNHSASLHAQNMKGGKNEVQGFLPSIGQSDDLLHHILKASEFGAGANYGGKHLPKPDVTHPE